MIASSPPILGLNIENIKQKIEDLKALGFANPEKMIASFSPILGLNIENIRKKISTVDTIFKLYDIEIETNHFIEENLSLLGTKIDKIWIIARMLRALEFDRNLITESFLSRLLFSNITDATVATALLNQSGRKNFSRGEIVGAIHEAKTKSAEEKNNIIDKLDNSKLKRRYARGYGERKSKIS
jgi:hypothetical protein